MGRPVATDDLNAPLGQRQDQQTDSSAGASCRRRLAGVLGLFVLVFVLWAAIVDNPLGGEPAAVVCRSCRRQEGRRAARRRASGSAPAPDPAAEPRRPHRRRHPDHHHHRRLQRQAAGGDRAGPGRGQARRRSSRVSSKPRATVQSRKSRPTARARPKPMRARPRSRRRRPTARASPSSIGGLGVGASGTSDALGKLPGPVTFAFTPYGNDLDNLVGARARRRPRGFAAGADGAVRLSRQRSRAADFAVVAVGRTECRPSALAAQPLPGLCRHFELHGRALHRIGSRAGAGVARDRQARADLCR